MNIYRRCMALVEDQRSAQLRNTSKRRQARLAKFLAGHELGRWRRSGRSVVWR